jgi:hypothetical protein
VTRQQRMGEQSRLPTWPDVNVLMLETVETSNTGIQFIVSLKKAGLLQRQYQSAGTTSDR